MDSPVIVDSATKFGRGLDLDRDFPGFPFDDEGFGRRGDIRSHLDNLAARHPEFADHLLGPPWADVPFGGGGSLHRNRNRRASAANNHQQPDEDARSHTSGGSGASSHGSEPENVAEHKPKNPPGLRTNHTLDIGQHQHNMENPQQQQRNVRSMSAPPENRNNQNEHPRFVSRVDITPQGSPQQQQQQANHQSPQQSPQPQNREKSPAPQQQKPQAQQSQPSHGTVRHIPIFVEGRDEPVITRNKDRRVPEAPAPVADEPDFPRRQQSPPHFQRPSHFTKQVPSSWTHFQDPFFEHSSSPWPPRHPARDSPFGSFRHTDKQPRHTQQFQEPQHQTRRQAPQQHQQQHHTPAQSEPQSEPQPPKPKTQIQPKDPLEKVALVQQEVDALTEQVRLYTGNSRTDKQYMYLDEMLTRELIKLDDIETEGKENVRQARKQAIKSIQESISLLESKAPLPGQQQESQVVGNAVDEPMESDPSQDGKPAESMDTSEPPATEEQKAIPLPAPTSPTKATAPEEAKPPEEPASKITEQKPELEQPVESNTQTNEAPSAPVQPEPAATVPAEASPQEPPQKVEEVKTSEEPMESNSVPCSQAEQQQPDVEMRQPSPAKEVQTSVEPEKASEAPAVPVQEEEKVAESEEQKNHPKSKTDVTTTTVSTTEKPKKEPPPVPAKAGKSPKKAKKTPKKQPQPEPVSQTAIPMPAPGQ
ncbi:BAG domain-containing protein Samui isoform X2 [Copidosoma floridanum]|uniref:BAG domain-containing protein Samui isoform X2 n=1 Tax=Copidosoma floridanum TaxID=29053 RepID=UPI0006C9C034|nr:BAG domain-containing protein Samui isoform X2 [Copidosoma floridanum]